MRFLWPILACLPLLLGALPPSPAVAEQSIYYAVDGVAIDGYDPVAYFTQGQAVRGSPGEAVMWKGVIWHFSSRTHREAFEANPYAYAPRYGGYCAYGVALGSTSTVDPTVWEIHDGSLYVINNASIHDRWQNDMSTYISAADENWPKVPDR